MVKVGEEKYAIALGSIETIEDVPVSEIKYVHAKEVINLRGNVIPLIRQMEIVIKSLGKYININRMISGATILGDGSVALIIDANTLV